MTRKLKTAAVLLLFCMACSNVKETPKGLTYTLVKKGDGVIVKPGQYLIANLFFKDAKDSVWFDSRKSEYPSPVLIPDTAQMKREDAIADLFRHLSKGDSVTFKMPADILFEKTFKQPIPPKMNPKDEFLFAIGVRDVIGQEQFQKMQQEMAEKQTAKINKDKAIQMGKDTVIIDSILTARNIKAKKTKSGIRYVVVKEGKGPTVERGQKITANYTGYTINGKVFDTSIESVGKAAGLPKTIYRLMELNAGTGRVQIGFDESLMLMNKGAKYTVYIPSPLMYGARQVSEDIGHNAILIFDIEMLNIQPGSKPRLK